MSPAPGSEPTGLRARCTTAVAGVALRARPQRLNGRPGDVICALTAAVVLASVRRSVTVGGLAGGAATSTGLVGRALRGKGGEGSLVQGTSAPHDERLAHWVVFWSGKPVLRATCLPRSLALWVVLRTTGHQARYCMGASKTAVTDPSHAWVEVDGVPVLEGDDPRERYGRFQLTGFYPVDLVG